MNVRISENGQRQLLKDFKMIDPEKYPFILHFPSVNDMEKYNVADHLDRHYSWLLFYEVTDLSKYMPDSAGYLGSKEWIHRLILHSLMTLPQAPLDRIRAISPEEWDGMSIKEKKDILEPLIINYGADEFDAFFQDLFGMVDEGRESKEVEIMPTTKSRKRLFIKSRDEIQRVFEEMQVFNNIT